MDGGKAQVNINGHFSRKWSKGVNDRYHGSTCATRSVINNLISKCRLYLLQSLKHSIPTSYLFEERCPGSPASHSAHFLSPRSKLPSYLRSPRFKRRHNNSLQHNSHKYRSIAFTRIYTNPSQAPSKPAAQAPSSHPKHLIYNKKSHLHQTRVLHPQANPAIIYTVQLALFIRPSTAHPKI